MCPQSHSIDNQLPNPEVVSLTVHSSLRGLLQTPLWHFFRPSAKTANSTMRRPSYHLTVLSFSSRVSSQDVTLERFASYSQDVVMERFTVGLDCFKLTKFDSCLRGFFREGFPIYLLFAIIHNQIL